MNELEEIKDEAIVLGCLIGFKDAYVKVSDILTPDTFMVEPHRMIYLACENNFKQGIENDILTVKNQLEKINKLEMVGGVSVLANMTNSVVSDINIIEYARHLKELQVRREVKSLASNVAAEAGFKDKDIFDTVEKLTQGISEITQMSSRVVKNTKQIIDDVIENIEKAKDHDGITGVETGLTNLDQMTGGFQNGDYIIVAGRPGSAKSAFAISASHFQANYNVPIGFASLELTAKQLIIRRMTIESNIPYQNILRGKNVWGDDFRGKVEIMDREDDPFYITTETDLNKICVQAKIWKAEHDIKILYIDYLQLISVKGIKGNREQEVATASKRLKQLAKELDIPIVAIASLNRSVEMRGGDKRPQMSDLRECLSVETSMIYSDNDIQLNSNSSKKILSLNKSEFNDMDSENIPKSKNTAYRIKTHSGRFIDSTLQHSLLTSDGYMNVKDLTTNDSLAIAKNWSNKDGVYIPESKFIGWMLSNRMDSDKNIPLFATSDPDKNIPLFATSDPELFSQFTHYVYNKFGFTPKNQMVYVHTLFGWYIAINSVITTNGSIIIGWLQNNELLHKNYIPKWFMNICDNQSIYELISGLWEYAGSISLKEISYSTSSKLMSNQLVYLFAKIGIIVNINYEGISKKQKDKVYHIVISNPTDIKLFKELIPLIGKAANELNSLELRNKPNHLVNRISRRTTIKITKALKEFGVTKQLIKATGNKRTTQSKLKSVLSQFPRELKKRYRWLVSDNIYWDSIVSIEKIGEVHVFDRRVPKTNNYVVNGIVCHNSGQIEFDADLIGFVHRPEMYGITENSEGVSTIDKVRLLIEKHRNGRTGDFDFDFIKSKMHWMNYTAVQADAFTMKPPQDDDGDVNF